mgnify:CR=1 FL=1
MKTLKRHLTVTICSAAVLFLIILVMIQSVEKNKIMGDLGQLKQRNMELQKACDELQKQIEQYENSNAELEEELIKEKRTAAAGWQTFYGVWNVSLYGEDDSVTIQADIPEVLSAPVNSSQIYGSINIYVNNEPFRSISLKAKQSIPKKVHVLDIINKIFQ